MAARSCCCLVWLSLFSVLLPRFIGIAVDHFRWPYRCGPFPSALALLDSTSDNRHTGMYEKDDIVGHGRASQIKVDKFVTHKFPFEDMDAAIKAAKTRNSLKVLVTMSTGS